jgi:hypothetical protein
MGSFSVFVPDLVISVIIPSSQRDAMCCNPSPADFKKISRSEPCCPDFKFLCTRPR